jgi:hypothetical protein
MKSTNIISIRLIGLEIFRIILTQQIVRYNSKIIVANNITT